MLRLALRAHRPTFSSSPPSLRQAVALSRRTYSSTNAPEPVQEWNNEPRTFRHKAGLAAFGVALAGLVTFYVSKHESPAKPKFADVPLTPYHFVDAPVLASTPAGADTKLITVALTSRTRPSTVPTEIITEQQAQYVREALTGGIWSVYVKNTDLQIERPYTPLEAITPDGRMTFWVKKYEDGEMGRWLHARGFKDRLEVRGPVKTWTWPEGEWDEVVMISGGTGITPFYQLIHQTLLAPDAPAKRPHFTLLHASASPAALPPAAMLNPLLLHAAQHPDALSVSLFVDALPRGAPKRLTYPLPAGPEPSLAALNVAAPELVADTDPGRTLKRASHALAVGRIDRRAIEGALEQRAWWERMLGLQKKPKRVLVLVCGPEPMIAAIAGPRGKNMSQGAVGGALGELGYQKGQVFKL